MAIPNWTWKPEPDYTRLERAIRRKGDSAEVPFLELFADAEIVAGVLGEDVIPSDLQEKDRRLLEAGLDQKIRFWYELGYDAFWQGPILTFDELLRLEADDPAPLARERRDWVDEGEGVITSWETFESYPWPTAEDADFYPLEYIHRRLPEGMAILGSSMGVLEPVMWLMGYETFALALYDQPALVEAMFARIGEILLPIARTLVDMELVIALWMGDDMGFKTGTMISPEHLRKFVFPLQKRVAEIAHAAGKPFLLHSCGQLEVVMEDLIQDVGIDSKHSFEDIIEPVESFVSRYGERISVVGGVDVDLLARGSEAEVRLRTRQILERCTPSGAYILGSGNSIANYVEIGNFLAMVDEGWRFRSS